MTDKGRYEGEVNDNGDPHGNGTYYYANGDRYEGSWNDGSTHGQGVLYFSNGWSIDGEFEHGRFCQGKIHADLTPPKKKDGTPDLRFLDSSDPSWPLEVETVIGNWQISVAGYEAQSGSRNYKLYPTLRLYDTNPSGNREISVGWDWRPRPTVTQGYGSTEWRRLVVDKGLATPIRLDMSSSELKDSPSD